MASIVVIFLPAAADIGVVHDRMGWPSRCTVQAPQRAAPQPNFVPIRPRLSRITQRSGVVGSASTERASPLTTRRIMGASRGKGGELWRQDRAHGNVRLANATSPRRRWKT